MKKLLLAALLFASQVASADTQVFPCFSTTANLLSCLVSGYSIVWPAHQGANGTTLVNDGFGNLVWGTTTISVPTPITGAAHNEVFFADNSGNLNQSPNLTFSGSTLTSGTLVATAGLQLNGSSSGSTTLQAAATASGALTVPSITDTLVSRQSTDQGANRLKNKDLSASSVQFVDSTDTTKALNFSLSGASSGDTMTLASAQTAPRTLTLPDVTDTLTANSAPQTLINKTISGASNTISNVSLTTGVTGTLPVGNGGTGVTSSTGSGSVVLSNSPALVTPALGTPASGVLTNATGLPLTSGVTGVLPVANGGTNSSTALNNNRFVVSSGGKLGEASAVSANSAVASDANGLPVASSTTATELGFVHGVTSAVQTQLDSKLPLGGGTLTGPLVLSGDASQALNPVTLQQFNAAVFGLSAKNSVAVATTANITLSGEQTIDGVTTSASRVLVKNQSTASQNGVYTSGAGAWTRVSDMNTWAMVLGALVPVDAGGTVNGGTIWLSTSPQSGTIGTTSVTFTQMAGAGTYTADGTNVLLTGNQFSLASNLTSNAANVTGTVAVANGGTGVTSSTGSGSVVLSTSPTLTTPNLGTPSAATLTNATGLPLSTGVTGTLPIGNGGTGQTTQTAAFDGLSPTTTTGDLIYYNGTHDVRLSVGASGTVLHGGTNPAYSDIVNADIDVAAAIAGTKVSPNFGSQAVTTTGSVSGATHAVTGTGGSGYLDYTEQSSSPSAPASSTLRVYGKTDDNLYFQNSAGTEQQVGSGSGEKNYIATGTSTSAGWTTTGTVAVATDSTSSDPRPNTTKTAVKFTSGAAADYAYKRFTLDDADFNKKLKIQFEQNASVGTDWKVEIYSNTASDYTGTSTRIALSTDSSSVSLLPGLTGTYRTTFDAPGAAAKWMELRLVRVANSSTLYASDLVVGPGVVTQGAAVSGWTSYTPTVVGNTTSANAAQWRRVGDTMQVQGYLTASNTTTVTLTVTLPSGYTINTAALGKGGALDDVLGYGTVDSSSFTTLNVMYGNSTAVQFARTGASNVINASNTIVSGNVLDYGFTVPINEWAGSGTVNVVQNDVEYVYNTSTSTTANDTTSFGYGPGGAQIQAITANLQRSVQFRTPVSATDKITVEIWDGVSGHPWVDATSAVVSGVSVAFNYQNGTSYGIGVVPTPAAGGATVNFGQFAVNLGTYGAGTTRSWNAWGMDVYYWRVRKIAGGQAVGFGIVQPGTSAGLVSASGVPGNTTGNAIATGYVGEFPTGTKETGTGGFTYSTQNATVPTTSWGTVVSQTLNKGIYLVSAYISCQGSATTSLFAKGLIGGTLVTQAGPGSTITSTTQGAVALTFPVQITTDATVVAIQGLIITGTASNAANEMWSVRIA